MAPSAPPGNPSSPGSTSTAEKTRLAEHLARSATAALATLLGPRTVELLGKLGPDATSPAGLAYFIISLCGERGALRRRDIRNLLLATLDKPEATELCHLLQLPAISPLQTLSGLDFDTAPGNFEVLERWYGLVDGDIDTTLQASEGSHKVIASHKLHANQLNAFRELRRAIIQPPCSALVHMPFGAGKLRLVATAALDLYRSDADDRSIVWMAPGTVMCEEAFLELQQVWLQLGSRDITILQLYGDHPARDLDQLGGAIAVIDMLRVSKDDPALKKLGSDTSIVVLADAESVIHPVGAEIVAGMFAGGSFSVVGLLATSGAVIPAEPSRSALKAVFSGACITIEAEDELRLLREPGGVAKVEATVVHLTTPAGTSGSLTASLPGNDASLEFDWSYANVLSNNLERNERLLEILKKEATGKGRVVFYATTAEHAKLFAGMLRVQGVRARAITAEEGSAARALSLQKFVAREERVLCIHGFLLSGTSVPNISVCLMAAPCKSRATLLSTIGRLVQVREHENPTLRLIVAADTQAEVGWIDSLSTWSTLNT